MTRASRITLPVLVLVFGLIWTLLAPSTAQAVYTPGQDDAPQPYIIDGIVTVVFSDDADLSRYNNGFGRANFDLPTLDAALEKYAVESARKLFPWEEQRPDKSSGMPDYTRYYELSFPASTPVDEVVAELEKSPYVALAEPVWAQPLAVEPNDAQYNSQWHWNNSGMNQEGAWESETGSARIVLAMVDSGVNHQHSDLRKNIWINEGEDLDGDREPYDKDDLNGVDDDGNGVVDDLNGYDFFTGISSPHPNEDQDTPDPDYNDYNGHGTHCGGIVCAVTNNGSYVAGQAGWSDDVRGAGVQLMCLRVGATATDGLGYVNVNNCGTAIQYAARNGAHVVNCSWGSGSSATMVAAMILCDSAGMTVVHAAGNENSSVGDYLDGNPQGQSVLSVSSVNYAGVKSSFSNYGFWVDVSAFGEQILSTVSNAYNPSTDYYWGTSQAAPQVAGLAALIRSMMPSLTSDQVDSIIINTADNIDAANPSYIGALGSGRINANNALAALANAKFTADVTDGEAPLQVQFTDLSPYSPTAWNWDFGTGDYSTDQNPLYTYNDAGVYDVTMTVDDSSSLGDGEEYKRNLIWVRADTLRFDSLELVRFGSGYLEGHLVNTAPVSEIQLVLDFETTEGFHFDSFSVVGTVAESFDDYGLNAASGDKFSYMMEVDELGDTTSVHLAPGTNTIIRLYFRTDATAFAGDSFTFDTTHIGGKYTYAMTPWGDYIPMVVQGTVYIDACGTGDFDCDGGITIADLVFLVDYMFNEGPAPDPLSLADIDGDGDAGDIADLIYLVNYMFNEGPPPPGW